MLNALGKSYPLEQGIRRGANNLDLFRLIAAFAVIYGHSFSLVASPGSEDIFARYTGHSTAGIAVKLFFFLSGVLVTNSLMEKRSAIDYIFARIFRIWPALLFVLTFSALIIGPIFTTLDLQAYFSDPNTYLYIKRQALMQSWGTQGLGYYNLPGVFANNPYKDTVNASLWSLVVEVYAYIFLIGAFLIGLFNRRIVPFLFALILLDTLLPERLLFSFLPKGNEDFSYLPFCFASGSFLAFYKDKINMSAGVPIGFLLLLYLFKDTAYSRYFFYLFCFTTVLFLSMLDLTRAIKLPVDISYGVFLWGFPMQQCLVHLFPEMSATSNQIAAACLAAIMGTISWYLIERHSITVGRELSRRTSSLLRRRTAANTEVTPSDTLSHAKTTKA